MTELSEYTHIECDVTAAQFTKETQGEIAAEIMKHAQAGLLDVYDLATDNKTGAYTLTFRYVGDTSSQTVSLGDYVVVLNTGNYFAVPEADFIKNYLHSELDPEIDPAEVKSVEKALVDLAIVNYSDLGIKTEADLTEANLVKLVEAMKDTAYDAVADEFTINFKNCGLVNFNGIGRIINAFMRASYVTMKTSVVYQFENSAPEEDDVNRSPNQFDIIGLTDLIAEMKLVEKSSRLHGTLITFGTRTPGVASSVLPSVTDQQFTEFKNELGTLFSQNFTVNLEVK